MLLVSFLLVIVATIFLVSGLFLTKDLALIFISIGCSALAGLVLVMAVLRSRPRPAGAPAVEEPAPVPVGASEEREPAPAAAAAKRKPAVPAFPIEHYDDLEVVEVLPLLGELAPFQLEMVRQREASGRAHPWVLARIDALLESEADTGEVEWADDTYEPAEEYEPAAGGEEEPDWAEPEPEWAPSRGGSEWTASDFPLESGADSDYDALEVVRDFPIDDYDNLRANEILPLLSDLDAEDLKMVREVEAGGKARTSILSRVDALLARTGAMQPLAGFGRAKPVKKAAKAVKGPSKAALALPIEDYDSLTVGEITARLVGLSVTELRAVRTYERRHKNRLGVLQKIDGAILRATR